MALMDNKHEMLNTIWHKIVMAIDEAWKRRRP